MSGIRKNLLLLVSAIAAGAAITSLLTYMVGDRSHDLLSSLLGSQKGGHVASACTADDQEEIYFVSCGGTF